jgi:alkanesulfonate monooxygenase SsuD/methylene tetrahydromethanopterin reductase-like flavin-dependent oxidoreductase (luciferase family)
VKALLAGDKVTEDYETFAVRGMRLADPPVAPVPVMVAALRPGMLRLANTESDGAITNWLSADDVSTVASHMEPAKELIARIFVCPSEDAGHVRQVARRMIAQYILAVPAYWSFHEWLGRAPMLDEAAALWSAGERRAAAAAIPDAVVDELVVHGSPGECREHVARYVANGVTTPVLALLPTGDDPLKAARDLAPNG